MNRADFFIGICRQKFEQLMVAFNGICFGAALTMPVSPDTGEEGERPILVACEPSRCLTRLCIGVLAERIERRDCSGFQALAMHASADFLYCECW
jgi:hypothetical protein